MAKYALSLELDIDPPPNQPSFEYRTDISIPNRNEPDKLVMTHNRIVYHGERSKRKNNETVLKGSRNYVRKAIEKALVIYALLYDTVINIEGKFKFKDSNTNLTPPTIIPELKTNITLEYKPYERLAFSSGDVARLWQILGDKEYIFNAIVLWLRGHFSDFEGENFLYLWMSLNSLYNALFNGAEWKKLKTLAEKIEDNAVMFADEIKLMGNGFIKELSYTYIKKAIRVDKDNTTMNNNNVKEYLEAHRDKLLLSTIRGVISKSRYNDKKKENIEHVIDEVMKEANDNPLAQYSFFITRYVYQIRCDYFHASKSVPVYSFDRADECRHFTFVNPFLRRFLFLMITAEVNDAEQSVSSIAVV